MHASDSCLCGLAGCVQSLKIGENLGALGKFGFSSILGKGLGKLGIFVIQVNSS